MEPRRPATAALGRLVVAGAGTSRSQDMRPSTGAPAPFSSGSFNQLSDRQPAMRPASAAAVRQAASQIQERAVHQLQAAGPNTTSDQLLAQLRKSMNSPLAVTLHAPMPLLPLQTEYRKHFSRSSLSTPAAGNRPMTAQTTASAPSAWQGASFTPPKPAVRPHACTPYKPGSILVPAPSAATAAGRPATAAHQVVPGAAGFITPSPAARPSTAMRPSTANPITHALLAHASGSTSTPTARGSTHGQSSSSRPGGSAEAACGSTARCLNSGAQQSWVGVPRPGSAMSRPVRLASAASPGFVAPPNHVHNCVPSAGGLMQLTGEQGTGQAVGLHQAACDGAGHRHVGSMSQPVPPADGGMCVGSKHGLVAAQGSVGIELQGAATTAADAGGSSTLHQAAAAAAGSGTHDHHTSDFGRMPCQAPQPSQQYTPSPYARLPPDPAPQQRAVSPYLRASGAADGLDVVAQMDRLLHCLGDATLSMPLSPSSPARPCSALPPATQPSCAGTQTCQLAVAGPIHFEGPQHAADPDRGLQSLHLPPDHVHEGSVGTDALRPPSALARNLKQLPPAAALGGLPHVPLPFSSQGSPAAAAPISPTSSSQLDAAGSSIQLHTGALSTPPPATPLLFSPGSRPRDWRQSRPCTGTGASTTSVGTGTRSGTPAVGLPQSSGQAQASRPGSAWSTAVQLQPRAAVMAAVEAEAQKQLDVLRGDKGHDQGMATRPVTAAEEAWWAAKAVSQAGVTEDDVASIDIVNGMTDAEPGGLAAGDLRGGLSTAAAARMDTADAFLAELKATLAQAEAALPAAGVMVPCSTRASAKGTHSTQTAFSHAAEAKSQGALLQGSDPCASTQLSQATSGRELGAANRERGRGLAPGAAARHSHGLTVGVQSLKADAHSGGVRLPVGEADRSVSALQQEPQFVRQAAPMVLNLENVIESTPEVLDFEMERMGLDELVQLNRLVDRLAQKGR